MDSVDIDSDASLEDGIDAIFRQRQLCGIPGDAPADEWMVYAENLARELQEGLLVCTAADVHHCLRAVLAEGFTEDILAREPLHSIALDIWDLLRRNG